MTSTRVPPLAVSLNVELIAALAPPCPRLSVPLACMVAVRALASRLSICRVPRYDAVVGPIFMVKFPVHVPSSSRPVTSAPGRQGATRSRSMSALHTRSMGASTSNDCSSFISHRLQIIPCVYIAARGQMGAFDLLAAAKQLPRSSISLEALDSRVLSRPED